MITLNGIHNTKQFFTAVDQCKGPVIAEFPDAKIYDLKTNFSFRKEMSTRKDSYNGNINIYLPCTEDTLHMIDYMARSYCETNDINLN